MADQWELDTLVEINKLLSKELIWSNSLESAVRGGCYYDGVSRGADKHVIAQCSCPHWTSPKQIAELLWFKGKEHYIPNSWYYYDPENLPLDIKYGVVIIENDAFRTYAQFAVSNYTNTIQITDINQTDMNMEDKEMGHKSHYPEKHHNSHLNNATQAYIGVCPCCKREGTFEKRDGFHLRAKYYCHQCKSTFSKPEEMAQGTSINIRHEKKEYKSDTHQTHHRGGIFDILRVSKPPRRRGKKNRIRLI
jgi:hypothetical protein